MDISGIGATVIRSIQHHKPSGLRFGHLELCHCRVALPLGVADLWDCIVCLPCPQCVGILQRANSAGFRMGAGLIGPIVVSSLSTTWMITQRGLY